MKNLGSHVFATADNTFRSMMKSLEHGIGKDQYILVSE